MTTFESPLSVTYIGTATVLIEIDGINLLTDPVFRDAGAEYDLGVVVLKSTQGPAIKLNELPPIDAVLLSHEDHPDNLDESGRLLLDGRKVITTMDGAKKLAPRPGVRGINPWETVKLNVAGKSFDVTGTPCQHLPGGECTGFILASSEFGSTEGKPNIIFISGDTVYLEELVSIRERYHVSVAILHLGIATVPLPEGPLPITMGGKDGAKLARKLGAEVVIPIHFEPWSHFAEGSDELHKILDQEEDIKDKIRWLKPGLPEKIF
ncbi:beta-lactamase superfamily domain-containing protein [Phascolomyces articulosus]|uniref:Beta-lactamase superfamily domain-containing protein n=1 Tax=Phascolomyces articulosus TaxID=60185 RepID=A0AAD5PH75_9FUNG|nr:beta-lactamase superfamily domain-containing protein [Phascolomyces articulosus]